MHEWPSIKTWVPLVFEEKQTQDSIEGLTREYMKANGVAFVAGLK